MKYVNRFLKRYCAEELVSLFSCTNNPMKEISESMAPYVHLSEILYKDNEKFEDYINFHIGDGHTCRTGALFSYMSKSTNYSIDPKINEKYMEEWENRWEPQRFFWIKNTWEDALKPYAEKVCVVLVHSHVSTMDVLNNTPNWKYCYVNPCCHKNKQVLSIQQLKSHNIEVVLSGYDNNILSPENQIYVYKNDENI